MVAPELPGQLAALLKANLADLTSDNAGMIFWLKKQSNACAN